MALDLFSGIFGGSSNGSYNAMENELTANEEEIYKEIMDDLAQSEELQQIFLPQVMMTAGYKYDDNGNIVQIPWDEYIGTLNPVLKSQYENLRLIQDQTKAALTGEGVVSPTLEQNLEKEQNKLNALMTQRLGPRWQETTSGAQAQSEFNKNAISLREAVRNQQLTNYNTLATQGLQDFLTGQELPYKYATNALSLSSGLVPSYLKALEPYQAQRALTTQQGNPLLQTMGQLLGNLASQGIDLGTTNPETGEATRGTKIGTTAGTALGTAIFGPVGGAAGGMLGGWLGGMF